MNTTALLNVWKRSATVYSDALKIAIEALAYDDAYRRYEATTKVQDLMLGLKKEIDDMEREGAA